MAARKKKFDIDSETELNLRTLIQIRDSIDTTPAVRIQAIQTMQKIMDSIGVGQSDDKPKAEDIIKQIRGAKK